MDDPWNVGDNMDEVTNESVIASLVEAWGHDTYEDSMLDKI